MELMDHLMAEKLTKIIKTDKCGSSQQKKQKKDQRETNSACLTEYCKKNVQGHGCTKVMVIRKKI